MFSELTPFERGKLLVKVSLGTFLLTAILMFMGVLPLWILLPGLLIINFFLGFWGKCPSCGFMVTRNRHGLYSFFVNEECARCGKDLTVLDNKGG